MDQDAIRAKRIELEDENGDLSMVLDGDSRSVVMYGPDGPSTRVALNVQENGNPVLVLSHPSNHTAIVTFNDAGEPAIVLNDPSGQNRVIPLRNVKY